MIVYKRWISRGKYKNFVWHGWFLFGFAPIYMKREGLDVP